MKKVKRETMDRIKKTIANFLQNGYEPRPKYICVNENEYVRGFDDGYSDREIELGEACVAYMQRKNFDKLTRKEISAAFDVAIKELSKEYKSRHGKISRAKNT